MAKKKEFQEITKDIFNLVCDLYPKWKALNSGIKEFNTSHLFHLIPSLISSFFCD